MKNRPPAATLKKVIVLLQDRTRLRGYLNPAQLRAEEKFNLLTPDGTHAPVALPDVRSVYFVREFGENFEPERKAFQSRPKLEGLWVRLKFRDNGDTIEGLLPNNLLELLDRGVYLTPPGLSGLTTRIFIPRAAIEELTVLGVIGIARRKPATTPRQTRLFEE